MLDGSPRAPRRWFAATALLVLGAASCSQVDPPDAPYEGHRPLEFLKVTQNFNPEIQWVGGRVAAVGINRGEKAALDSTLVWIRTAPTNSISSVVRVDDDFDWEFVENVGGTPQDQVSDSETYTFWLAEDDVFFNDLDTTQAPPGAFAATTQTMDLLLVGTPRSAMGVVLRVQRDELLTGDRYLVTWTPEDVAFRRLAINQGTTGGWTNHMWHIVVPGDQPPSITSPVVIGVPPQGVQQAMAWPPEGFMRLPPCPSGRRNYVLWAATDEWNESFVAAGPNAAPGYAQFSIHFSNFPEIPTPRDDC